jgi:hypothetical protein
LGQLASQLAACAGEWESFFIEQIDFFERMEQQIPGGMPHATRRHPHADDPVVASVLAQFAALQAAADEAT